MKVELTLQEKQREAFFKSMQTPVLFYGGAKGGGKSYLIRAREIYRRLTNPGTSGLIVRKTYPELLANHIRKFFVEYPFIRSWYNKAEKTIYYPNGSTTEFSYLQHTDDVYTYQGREYEDASIDEITQHEEEVFKILRTSVRTSNQEFAKKNMPTMLLTGNPGGIGHAWAKRLFIDRNFNDKEHPDEFGFVQAKVWDNKALMDADPEYLRRLQDLPEDLRRAYLEGDWDIFAGQVFSEFRRDLHQIQPYLPSQKYPHYLWMDWGYSGKDSHQGAFAGYASAMIKATYQGEVFNRVITYKEWYGKHKTPEEWAEAIYNQTPIKYYREGRTDPSMHNLQSTGATSISKLMEQRFDKLNGDNHWVTLKKGSNNRIERVATVHNWLSVAPDGLPYWLISETCPHLIRTLPLLVYDETNIEDVDCFVKGTKVTTPNGYKLIEDVKVGDLVCTPIGNRKVTKAGISGDSERVVEVTLSNGKKLKGTANHCVYVVGKGLVELQKLKEHDILMGRNINIRLLWQLKKKYTKTLHSGKVLAEGITDLMEHISGMALRSCIGKYTKTTSEKYQKVMTSITKTTTITIIHQTILRLCQKLNTLGITTKSTTKTKKQKTGYTSGTEAKKVRKFLGTMREKWLRIRQKENCRADIVGLLLKLDIPLRFFAKAVNISRVTMRSVVPSVIRSFFKRKMESVLPRPVHIVAVGSYEEEIVYKLTVEEAHLYYANGVLVTNTEGEDHPYDASGYGLSSIRFIPATLGRVDKPKPGKPKAKPATLMDLDLTKFEKRTPKSRPWQAL